MILSNWDHPALTSNQGCQVTVSLGANLKININVFVFWGRCQSDCVLPQLTQAASTSLVGEAKRFSSISQVIALQNGEIRQMSKIRYKNTKGRNYLENLSVGVTLILKYYQHHNLGHYNKH